MVAIFLGFAQAFDFQPFHLDEAAAKDTFVGTLIGSGWHTAALGMRLLQQGPFRGGSSLGAPGIDELRWLPVDAGALEAEIAPELLAPMLADHVLPLLRG